MTLPAPDVPDTTEPQPRRRMGCLPRLFIASVILLLVQAVLHGIWNWRTHRQLQARVAELLAAGEPMTVEALAPAQPVPDDQNAALFYKRAIAALDPSFIEWLHGVRPGLALPLRETEMEPLRDGVQASMPALELARQAGGMSLVDWQVQWSTPIVFSTIPYLKEVRSLAHALHAAALLAHHDGDDAAALRYIGQMESLADALEQQTTLIQHLVACGVRALAVDAIGQVMPDLNIADGSSIEARGLIARLLDDGSVIRGQQDAWRFERLGQYDAVMGLTGAPLAPASQPSTESIFPEAAGAKMYLLKPLFFTDSLVMLNHMTGLIAITSEPTWWRHQQAVPALPENWRGNLRYLLSNALLPSFDRAGLVHYRILADRRLAATALAIRLYAHDHDGQLPPTLEALVPAYLPAVPRDPFSKDDALLRYDAEAAILYSVSDDGTDEGGSREPRKPSWRYEEEPPGRWETLDAVFHLTRQPRPPAPQEEQDILELP